MSTRSSMATLAGPTARPLGLGHRLRVAVRRGFALIAAWYTRAEQRHQLALLTEHPLRDIGLTRAQVDEELRKPFWQV